jgi:hypothetical protein
VAAIVGHSLHRATVAAGGPQVSAQRPDALPKVADPFGDPASVLICVNLCNLC